MNTIVEVFSHKDKCSSTNNEILLINKTTKINKPITWEEVLITNEVENDEIYPVDLNHIKELQQKDRELRRRRTNDPNNYTTKEFENKRLICYKDRIYIPEPLCTKIMRWYHHWLCHPMCSRLYKTLASTMYWPGIEKEVIDFSKHYKVCKRYKKQPKKHGKLSTKNVNLVPWDTVCVDYIGPYPITTNKGENLELNVMIFLI